MSTIRIKAKDGSLKGARRIKWYILSNIFEVKSAEIIPPVPSKQDPTYNFYSVYIKCPDETKEKIIEYFNLQQINLNVNYTLYTM